MWQMVAILENRIFAINPQRFADLREFLYEDAKSKIRETTTTTERQQF